MDIGANAIINGQTLQSLLRISSKDLANGLDKDTLLREARQDGSFSKWLAQTQWPSLSESAASSACSLMSNNVVDIFAGAWSKFSELTKCAKETVKHPGSTSDVVVGDHDFTYENKPALEILLDGKSVGEIPFTVGVTFTVNAMVLTITSGCVTKVLVGRLKWSAYVKCGSKEVWSHELGELDLPGELKLHDPISILGSKAHDARKLSDHE
jgi:hypothetical protein